MRTQHVYEVIEDIVSKQYFVHDWIELAPLVDRMPLTAGKEVTLDPYCWSDWQNITRHKEFLNPKEGYDSAVRFLVHHSKLLGAEVVDKMLGFLTFQRWTKAFKEHEKVSI